MSSATPGASRRSDVQSTRRGARAAGAPAGAALAARGDGARRCVARLAGMLSAVPRRPLRGRVRYRGARRARRADARRRMDGARRRRDCSSELEALVGRDGLRVVYGAPRRGATGTRACGGRLNLRCGALTVSMLATHGRRISSISNSRSPSSKPRSRSCGHVDVGRRGQHPGRDRAAAGQEPAAHAQHLRQPHALADHAARAPPAAALHARLHRRHLSPISTSCTAIACTPTTWRIVGGLARLDGRAGHGHRPPEGARHQGARAPQLRHAQARGLPQGAAPHAARRALRPAARHAHRHAGRLSRASAPRSAARARRSRATCSRWRRCAMPIISVVIGEGGSGGALAIGVCDRLLMLQYSHLLGDLARRLRLDPLEERRQEGSRGRGHGPHRRPAAGPRAGRRSAERAARRRAPRSGRDGGRRLRAALLRHLDELEALPPDELLRAARRATSPASACSPRAPP